MKFAAVSIFVLLLLTQICGKWLLILEYELNKEFIAKNLCQNKNKPQLKCKGKCQLSKKLAAEENGTNSKPSSGNAITKNSLSETVYQEITDGSPSQVIYTNTQTFNGYYLLKKYSSPAPSIFHPPLV